MNSVISLELRSIVRSTTSKLEKASTCANVYSALNELCSYLQLSQDSSGGRDLQHLFVETHYLRFANVLLTHVRPSLLHRLTLEQRSECVDPFFLYFAPSCVLSALSSALQHQDDEISSSCTRLLHRLFKCRPSLLKDLLLESFPSDSSVKMVTSSLCSIPDRVANVLGKDVPVSLRSGAFFSRVIDALVHHIFYRCINEDASDTSIWERSCVPEFIGKLVRVGQADVFSSRFLCSSRSISGDPQKHIHLRTLFKSIPTNTREGFLEHLLRSSSKIDIDVSISTFEALLPEHTDMVVIGVLLHRILLRRVLNKRSLFVLISYLSRSIDSSSLCFSHVLQVWYQPSFIEHTSIAHQMCISQALVFFLHRMDVSAMDDVEDGVSMLLKGVQHRLQNPDIHIRRSGMRVAEQLSLILTPDKPLCFDKRYADDDDGDGDAAEEDAPAHESLFNLGLDLRPYQRNEEANRFDHDREEEERNLAPEDNEAEERTAGLWEDVDQLSDDEFDEAVEAKSNMKRFDSDRKKIRKPVYVRECLEMLNRVKQDSYDEVEVILEALEALVRARPNDLVHVCESLLRRLLHLRNEWKLDGFEESRRSILIAIVVVHPDQVVPILTDAFYDQNFTIHDRLMILTVLANAANELANGRELEPETAKGKSTIKMSKTELVIAERVESNTRRWSQKSNVKRGRVIVNRFAEHAHLFVIPLLSRIDSIELSFRPLDEDAIVLTKLLYVLGSMLQCSGVDPVTRSLVVHILPLIQFVRSHHKGTVRGASMFALLQILKVLPSHVLMADFNDEIEALLLWLVESCKQDPEKDVRSLASLCLKTLHEKISDVVPSALQ